jgi:hypothetical protein
MGNQLAAPSKPGVEHAGELLNTVVKETMGEQWWRGCAAVGSAAHPRTHAPLDTRATPPTCTLHKRSGGGRLLKTLLCVHDNGGLVVVKVSGRREGAHTRAARASVPSHQARTRLAQPHRTTRPHPNRCFTSAGTPPRSRPTSSSWRQSGVLGGSWGGGRYRRRLALACAPPPPCTLLCSNAPPHPDAPPATPQPWSGVRCWGCRARTCGRCRRGGRRPTPRS